MAAPAGQAPAGLAARARPLRPASLDPYPGFYLASLDFSLDCLDQLFSYQLALVGLHPQCTPELRTRADDLLRTRRESAQRRGYEDGFFEKNAEMRQLQRAKRWLEGTLPQSRNMRDMAVQTDPPPPTPPPRPQPTAARPASPLASPDAPAPAPLPSTSALPATVSASSPGPRFSFPDSMERCPPALHSQLHILWCGDLDEDVTTRLFLHFLLRRQREPFPRPLAIKRSASGAILLGFRSSADVDAALGQLDDVALPLMGCRIRAVARGNSGSEFRWCDLSDEVRHAWTTHGRLPDAALRYVDKVDPPEKGVKVSKGYHAEWVRIQRARQAAEAELTAQYRPRRRRYGAGWSDDDDDGSFGSFWSSDEDDPRRSTRRRAPWFGSSMFSSRRRSASASPPAPSPWWPPQPQQKRQPAVRFAPAPGLQPAAAPTAPPAPYLAQAPTFPGFGTPPTLQPRASAPNPPPPLAAPGFAPSTTVPRAVQSVQPRPGVSTASGVAAPAPPAAAAGGSQATAKRPLPVGAVADASSDPRKRVRFG
ncbi:hypothetical protein Rhopal_004669-T1 [Rhodotorula paludigena]|uniref:RRM domain-containing protein n=1 Tax=Rhodotorula paludigena TaxID=86838 RepID=A0AAV5GQ40_9BASI|nr:hypothetical protein Rhopal_004669-T1 [Rhodotorula paludigena]